ncbi:uncharacterized protein N7515_007971 [Penicillium bovifimosum]|uniref:Uncharacterized protein n=1 Tax=Penicillium bovifimosum TaxID=126998 RepID=A0A9W9GM45_9EURO|nr:uncharacterized protein N7515_007971 [Penicillium bovifimosum]KAJ5124146.1 hypothetical protein N7515_007971 [Penicillium bovifimosum]
MQMQYYVSADRAGQLSLGGPAARPAMQDHPVKGCFQGLGTVFRGCEVDAADGGAESRSGLCVVGSLGQNGCAAGETLTLGFCRLL